MVRMPSAIKSGTRAQVMIIKGMSWKQKVKQVFLKCDIFSTSEFLRYNNEPQYRTYTGAFFSVVTVAVFCGIFMSAMISTFQKTEIIWSLNTMNVGVDSFMVSTEIQRQDKFMFAVALTASDAKHDLNTNVQRMFDVRFLLRTKISTISQPDIIVPLEKCTLKHWNVSEQFVQIYERMSFSSMLCPPIGLQMPIQGKFTSDIFKYAEIRFVKCVANGNKSCANESALQNKTFIYNLYMLNTLVNPESAQYITYYLEDRNYVQFTTAFSSLLNVFISDYQITTDESIVPLRQERVEAGAIVTSLGQVIPKQADSNNYASIVLRRASTKLVVSRAFKRVDDTLSYIGGLFGFALLLLLFMKEYTEYSYQIDASCHLYSEDQQKAIESHRFNFFIFVGYMLFMLLDAVGFRPNWKAMQSLDDCREEIQKQLDVRFLFQRINFIQKSLSTLFSENQSQLLHLLRKPTLREASQLRGNYEMRKVLMHNAGNNRREATDNPLEITTEGLEAPWGRAGTNKVAPENPGLSEMGDGGQSPTSRQGGILQKIKGDFKLLQKRTMQGDQISRKIIQDLDPNIIKIIYEDQHEDSIANDVDQSHSIEKLQKSNRTQRNKEEQEEVKRSQPHSSPRRKDLVPAVARQEDENGCPFELIS